MVPGFFRFSVAIDSWPMRTGAFTLLNAEQSGGSIVVVPSFTRRPAGSHCASDVERISCSFFAMRSSNALSRFALSTGVHVEPQPKHVEPRSPDGHHCMPGGK